MRTVAPKAYFGSTGVQVHTLQIREPVFLSRMLFTVDGDLFFGKLREDGATLGVVFRRCGFGGC
jgi:hypothetical protein